ncbi:MAG: hypothetical protein HRU77_04195 [Gammaproteobacteria bacterium]|nr:MAG: hypothetical protein HRU77_04195 [Gammaproteobacteria bacterium]
MLIPTPIGWATERRLAYRCGTGEPSGSPRPTTHKRVYQAQKKPQCLHMTAIRRRFQDANPDHVFFVVKRG